MQKLEKDIEEKLKRVVKRKGGLYLKFTSPSVRGVPDRIVVWPTGRIDFVEIKRPKGNVRALQQYWLNNLIRLKQNARTVFCEEDIERLVKDAGV